MDQWRVNPLLVTNPQVMNVLLGWKVFARFFVALCREKAFRRRQDEGGSHVDSAISKWNMGIPMAGKCPNSARNR